MTKKENIIIELLEHAALNGFNVLLEGRPGTGKTAFVTQALDNLGWNWKYFSASTMDPHLHLIGIPREVNGRMEMLLPADIDFDNLEAIFLDEYNRSNKKVRNAVLELIQFKSINGKKFPKLKVIFAAINPDDDEEFTYDVEKLDQAQRTRFHQTIPVPNEPCDVYFKEKHGSVGVLAVKWWEGQDQKVKNLVSPRSLEYIVEVFVAKGDIKYVLGGSEINTGELAQYLAKPDPVQVLDDLCNESKTKKKAFFRDNNDFKHVRSELFDKDRYLDELSCYVPDEELMVAMRETKGNKFIGYVASNVDKFKHLITPVLNNPAHYSARIVTAFTAYRNSNGKTSSAASLNRKINIDGVETCITNMVLCFSGRLTMDRADAIEKVEAFGAKVVSTVSNEVTHLISVGTSGTKYKAAKRKGKIIIYEDSFYKMIQELDTPVVDKKMATCLKTLNNREVDMHMLTLANFETKVGIAFQKTDMEIRSGTSSEESFDIWSTLVKNDVISGAF